ncbi:MAG: exodeoxyribonuclease III [Rhodospirillales bacterium]
MTFRIATWNVNSVRKRLNLMSRLVAQVRPDVLCLQETKVIDALFPSDELKDMGFEHQAMTGQKGYNGVAILSRYPLAESACRTFLDSTDRRHIQADILLPGVPPVTVHSLYIPAGGDRPDPDRNPKFAFKLAFMEDLIGWLGARSRQSGRDLVLGDFNVAPLVSDVWSHEKLRRVVTHTDGERERLTRLLAESGLTDALRHLKGPEEKIYTWWSYRTPDWQGAMKGRRLDHLWCGAELTPRLRSVEVLAEARGWPEPSDHVPVIADFEL